MSSQVYKKSEFSRIAGVTRAAVTKAVRSGALIEEDGGIDITHPQNAAYLSSNRDKRPNVGNGKEKKDRPKPQRAPREPKPMKPKPRQYRPVSSNGGMLKEEADVLRIQAQTANLQLKYAERLKVLVLRKDVEQVFQSLYAVAVNYFLVLGDRLSPVLASLCGVNDQETVIKMKDRIDKEVTRALEELKRQTEIEL